LRDDAEVVRDQQHAHRPLGLQAAQQLENLRLNGDVERRRRLVGDQQARIAGERDGDHHPLLHAAGELEGVLAEATFRIGDADRGEQFERARACRLPGQPEMALEYLAQLVTDGEHRIEACRRFLEDHRHAAAAHAAHLGFRQAQQITPGETHLAADDPSGSRQQAQQAERRRRLATA